uniref:LysM domain-containing protein n=1 Tax=Parastrongyloides trichosuri TaxID=131310 RepID=A0A0N5A240_PARTI
MLHEMNNFNYNTIYNSFGKQKFVKNNHSNIGTEYPWFKNHILPMANGSPLFNNSMLGSGDYSGLTPNMCSSKTNASMTTVSEKLPAFKTCSKNDGIDGHRIYSRSTMVEIAWQYDSKEWKEILGQNPYNNFGILLTLQKEKNLNVPNSVIESIDSECTNDYQDYASYLGSFPKNNLCFNNYKKVDNGKPYGYTPPVPLYYEHFYTPYEIHNETFLNKKAKNERIYVNKEFGINKPMMADSTQGSQYSLPVTNAIKSPQPRQLWNSAYCGLLGNDSENTEANIYKMFLDKLIRKMALKSSQVVNTKKTSSQSSVISLSELENKSPSYTREEMLKISERYSDDQWKAYILKNFCDNDVVMNHLGKDIFIVDSIPMRPKMSKEVEAILNKRRKKGNVNKSKGKSFKNDKKHVK